MQRAQIQLPDALFEQARAFAREKEMSFAELTRRAIEAFLDRYPQAPAQENWRFPVGRGGGGVKVDLEDLKRFSLEDESAR